ncbi:MAG: amidase [Devosia sp.]|uniref:amidase n=1 Tax=Devosia sp. TaxID=1871048 RepID=UPI00339ACC0C
MSATLDLTASELARGIADRSLNPVETLAAFLDRIDAREGQWHAWAHVDRDGALAQAKLMTSEASQGNLRGPLHGVPVGVKDVFHAEGMPTLANSQTMEADAIYADSGVVAALRAAGAIILGKCETVEFAGMGVPPASRNPWNPAHTGGGSSSGSGVAVGARMVPATIGTQTGGSNLRPASYNGVAGFKPSYGALSRDGLLPVSWSLDHPGLIARSAEDLDLIFRAIAQQPGSLASAPKKIGILRDFFFETSEAGTVDVVETSLGKLAASGLATNTVPLPELFKAHQAIHHLIMSTEMAVYHAPRLHHKGDLMSPRHKLLVEAFSLVPASYYLQALRARRMLRDAMLPLFAEHPVLAMPTTPGPAPEGLESTGNASLLTPWSLLGFPAATIPCGMSENGLPLGLQLVGAPGTDLTVIAAATAAESVLGRLNLPD